MDVRRIQAELRMGRPLYDLPLRVTFYARVSTNQDEQIYYTELIQSRPAWRFVRGISGGTMYKQGKTAGRFGNIPYKNQPVPSEYLWEMRNRVVLR